MSKDRTLKQPQDTVLQAAKKLADAIDASAIDSNLAGLPLTEDDTSLKSTYTGKEDVKTGHTSIDPAIFKENPFSPDVQHIPSAAQKKAAEVRAASEIDLASLDESTIMDMPFIKAKAFDIAALLHIKLLDPAYRPRWVNFKSMEGGNYHMFKSIGFSNVTVNEVDRKATPLGEHIVKEDGSIKYYDVILMKCNTLRLMQAYKANVQKSLDAVGRWDKRAIEEARKTFRNEVSADIIQALRDQGHTIEFYTPSKAELDKDEAESKKFTSV